jgi:hypothetical protein
VHVVDRGLEPVETRADQLAAAHGGEVTGDQQFRLEGADAPQRLEVRFDLPVAVAPDRVEVGEVREQRTEHVAREQDGMLRQPGDATVDGFAARCRMQFDAQAAELEIVMVIEADVRDRHILRWRCRRTGRALCHRGKHLAEPDASLRLAYPLDACVVALALREVPLGDELRRRLAEMRDTADMVDVPLRQDDIRRRPRADRIEEALVRQRFEAHPRVDDESPGRGHEQVGIRQAGRLPDEVVDADRLLEIRIAVGEEIGAAPDQLSDDVHCDGTPQMR